MNREEFLKILKDYAYRKLEIRDDVCIVVKYKGVEICNAIWGPTEDPIEIHFITRIGIEKRHEGFVKVPWEGTNEELVETYAKPIYRKFMFFYPRKYIKEAAIFNNYNGTEHGINENDVRRAMQAVLQYVDRHLKDDPNDFNLIARLKLHWRNEKKKITLHSQCYRIPIEILHNLRDHRSIPYGPKWDETGSYAMMILYAGPLKVNDYGKMDRDSYVVKFFSHLSYMYGPIATFIVREFRGNIESVIKITGDEKHAINELARRSYLPCKEFFSR